MALQPAALAQEIHDEVLVQLEAYFAPQRANLLGPEQSGIDDGWDRLAWVIGKGVGPIVIAHFIANAQVIVAGVEAGGSTVIGDVT